MPKILEDSPRKLKEEARQSAKDMSWRVMLVAVLTCLMTSSLISMTMAKNEGGNVEKDGFRFEYVTVTLSQEILKLVGSVVCLLCEAPALSGKRSTESWSGPPRNRFEVGTFALYAIPGLLYCIDMNFQYIILGFLEPAELAILWNFKVFATALLMKGCLGRHYSRHQWVALLLLVFGCIVTQTPDMRHVHWLPRLDCVAAVWHRLAWGFGRATGTTSSVDKAVAFTTPIRSQLALPPKFVGAGLAVVGASIAAASNVFCEWLIKRKQQDSINFQTMQLYIFGVTLNSCVLFYKASDDPESPVHGANGFFTGYTPWVWAVVMLGAASGMIISFTLKFVDNIAIIFAHAVAVLVASGISSSVLGIPLSGAFVTGGMLVLSALVMFQLADPQRQLARLPRIQRFPAQRSAACRGISGASACARRSRPCRLPPPKGEATRPAVCRRKSVLTKGAEATAPRSSSRAGGGESPMKAPPTAKADGSSTSAEKFHRKCRWDDDSSVI
eukprot:TRINITY_DN34664_c0_g1_i2.p1 TRINITY_DN34664_c0_g1~~TRINITY_DN34664_c0_g1_i2.p1  ORF type:complete len:500 (+),score=85.63 TRINITY_DN34664_c0_g1_i2:214-1713(+)